jgi:hypothetical protein
MKEFDPGDTPASIISVTDKVRPLPIGMPVTSLHFLGDTAAFVGAEENVALVNDEGAVSSVTVHSGGILCVASDRKRIVMGGDDGKLVALDAAGEVTLLATDAKRRWIDNVALHPDGAVAWSAGKTAFVRSGKGEEKSFDATSTVGGLAFAPKGLRLAVAHYNGVTPVVSQHGGNGRGAGMGRFASRRRVQPRQQVSGDRDARAGTAWLATRR